MCRPREPEILVTKCYDETSHSRKKSSLDATFPSSDDAGRHAKKSWLPGTIRPLPPLFVMALIPLLPRSCYLNRGYTKWFHLMSVGYFLTRSPFLRRILIVQGVAVCLGWYAAIVGEWLVEGAFCHTLYRNMPPWMRPHMLRELPGDDDDDGGYVILYTCSSCAMKALSHVLDLVGHPGLACLFYRSHLAHGGTLRDVLSWPVIAAAWHISRAWSAMHTYHNTGTMGLWYFGHDVYRLNNLNAYLIAYVVEGACFGMAIVCRLCWDHEERSAATLASFQPMIEEHGIPIEKRDVPPALVRSESAESTSSMM